MAQKVETLPQKQHPMVILRDYLDRRTAEIKTALPAHISPERFIRVVMTAVQINPDLLACERASLWNACMRCASDGLIPDGTEAALVPFKGKVTYIPMYRGLLKKFRNSGEFKWITAGIVYEGDDYEHWISETGEHFRHVPSDDTTGKKVRRVYALATTKDGGSFIADLSLAEINKRKAMSRASREDAPWKMWESEMQKKTALRMLSKLLPMSSDLDALIQRDEAALLGVEAVDERRQAIARPVGNAALDEFAGAEESASQVRPDAEESGGGESAVAPAASEAEQEAYQRGKTDRSKGVAQRAIPGELREPARSTEAIAWIKGWKGESL